MPRSRREFVKLASTAAVAGVVLPELMLAELDDRRPIRDAFGVGECVSPDPHAIAAVALDAARSAGATFADVRVDRQLTQSIGIRDAFGGNVGYSENVGVGVRVIADGQWGFVGIDAPTRDTVAAAARRAVHQAQINAKGRRTPVALMPAPQVADGRWAAPVRIDPFTVPVGEQQEALLAGTKSACAVSGVKRAVASVRFLRVDRTFASTEGSLITQTFNLAFPGATVWATVADENVEAVVGAEGFGWKVAGYEVVPDATLPGAMRMAAAAALKESREMVGAAAPRSVDVGRYELVVGARIMSGLVQGTVISALGLDRALGKRAGEEGTSYAAPPERVLGTMQIGHPLLTVRGDRTTHGGLMTVGWDDEGVAPNEFTMVGGGVVLDYLAMRESAPTLGWWYQKRGGPVRAHGCAATGYWGRPGATTPNVTIAPGAEAITVEDMIRDVKRGIYLSGDGGASADFGLMNAYGDGSVAREVRNGKLVGHLKDVAIQFQVQPFWKGLQAIGGTQSVETFADGSPGLFACRTVRSVPARFGEVNVVNTGRTQ